MATAIKSPNYGEVYEISSLGLYGHNIVISGEFTPANRVYNSVKCIAGCAIDYVEAYPDNLPKIKDNTDSTITGLSLIAGETYILGCVKDIAVSGIGGKIVAHLISITE